MEGAQGGANRVRAFPRERFVSDVALIPAMVSEYASAAGDTNPVHHDADFAAATRYGRPIASGTFTTALLLGLTASHYSKCAAMVGQFWVRFRRPIYADETIRLEWLVVKVTPSVKLGGDVEAATAILNRMAITKARMNLSQLARRAHLNNEYFILEKDGIPVPGLPKRCCTSCRPALQYHCAANANNRGVPGPHSQPLRSRVEKAGAHHPGLPEHYKGIVGTLKPDPYNRSREHLIKKLRGVQADDGQYRIRSGRFCVTSRYIALHCVRLECAPLLDTPENATPAVHPIRVASGCIWLRRSSQ
jgi:acyl dehydratase